MNQVWMDVVIPGFCGMGMHLKMDGFRLVYCIVAVLMWTVSGIFSREYMAHYANRKRYYIFFWATFAATVGVFLSANLFTTFIFFEIMSFTSYVWVAFDERSASLKAAETYLAVAVIGGMVMLMGLFLLYDLFGTLEIDELSVVADAVMSGNWPLQASEALSVAAAKGTAVSAVGQTAALVPQSQGAVTAYSVIGGADGPTSIWVAGKLPGLAWSGSTPGMPGSFFPTAKAQLYTAGALLLFGFGAKAGCFPLHIWLPKAHPEAPAPASALLSGILTKTGVFGIIVVSCGLFGADHSWGLLIAVLGLITMFVGALLAVFSINLKRTLACSSISQIGFILTGIGMACLLRSIGEGNTLAVRGAFLHMVNHSLFKLVLFLCAGAVYMNLHKLDLNEIRGFGRKKPALMFAFAMGALGIGGIPLWNGYVSKTLIHESIVEYMEAVGGPLVWHLAEWVFLITGGMTVAYMLKLFVAVFVEKNADPKLQERYDGMCSEFARKHFSSGSRSNAKAARRALGTKNHKGETKTSAAMENQKPTEKLHASSAAHNASHGYMRPETTAALVITAAILPALGLTAHLSMDRIADLGQEFFHVQGHAHTVAYLSPANLKGGAISICIGVLLYFAVIRGLLMEPDGAGGRRYVDRWPSWLDLENLVYRPILQVALPAVFGAVFGFLDRYLVPAATAAFLTVSTFVGRVMDSGADWLIRMARLTTHKQVPAVKEPHDSDLAAHVIGGVIDAAAAFRSRLPWKRREKLPFHEPATARLVRREEQFKGNMHLIQESFSYGLMLVCVGLCVTLIYLIWGFLGK